LEITMASEQHLDEILRLCKNCSKNMKRKDIDQWDEAYPNKEIFQEDINNHSLYIAVLENSGELMGCIVLNDCQEPEYKAVEWLHEQGKFAIIHRLMVHPNYEGKGVARSLIEFLEKLAKENGYTAIRLDVFSENTRAVNFYKKQGYRVSGKVNFRKGEFLCCEKIIP